MNKVDYWYHTLLNKIGARGYKLEPVSRQDVGTIQIDNANFEHDLREGFPLLTTKKLSFKNIVVELLWFLRGDTNIKYLVDNGCNIWNSDAYKYYLRTVQPYHMEYDDFINEVENSTIVDDYTYGGLGPVYGKQWRDWNEYWPTSLGDGIYVKEERGIDQISNLIHGIKEVVRTGVNNRRLIVNAWNVGELDDMALPPCHYGFQVMLEPIPMKNKIGLAFEDVGDIIQNPDKLDNGTNKTVPQYYLNLKWNQRSVDTFLGLPYNIASYALLAHILGKLTNTIPKMLYGNLSNIHIYDTHMDAVKEQLTRKGSDLPELVFDSEIIWEHYGEWDFDVMEPHEIQVEGYNPEGSIKAEIVT